MQANSPHFVTLYSQTGRGASNNNCVTLDTSLAKRWIGDGHKSCYNGHRIYKQMHVRPNVTFKYNGYRLQEYIDWCMTILLQRTQYLQTNVYRALILLHWTT
jgi:hypothetical protein